MPRSIGYVDAEYLKRVAELGKSFKERTYELMQLQTSQRVLDLGCGPGVDTLAIARLMDGEFEVHGIDIDEEMIAHAEEAASSEMFSGKVIHAQGDVKLLPYESDEFDVVRAERLFQVLPITHDPALVLGEALRVCKPGGRILLADADWGSASVDIGNADLERRLMNFFAQRLRPNGFAGRQLYAWLKSAGVADIQVEVFPMLQLDYEQTPFGEWLQTEAEKADVAQPDETRYWHDELTRRSQQGLYFSTVNMVMVVGNKPH